MWENNRPRASECVWFPETRFNPPHIRSLHAIYVANITGHLGSGRFSAGIWGVDQLWRLENEREFFSAIDNPYSHCWVSWTHGLWTFQIDNYIETSMASVSISGPDELELERISDPVFEAARFISLSEAAA